ncbi:MAG: arachidonate 15-lipoxygenase, partial [Acidimicrobiaceae bacterium]|nr:arachidonate 15-lipoxygenase [Acidimicrobiaceae bacterium]
ANRLEAVRIDSDAGSSRPGDPDWETARRLAMCGATTHLSLIRHFQWVHLSVGAALAMATRNQLRADHPVRRLLWPHVFGTQYSNGMITRDLLSKGGDFEGIFSFTHGGLCDLLNATADDADLGGIHPDVDADRRGLAEGGFATPALDNRSALFAVMVAHTRRYLALYYPSDADLARDEEMMAWLGAVDDQVPNGIAGVAGYGATVEGTAQLLATAVYVASVEHEIVGSGVWDYQLWTDVNPARVQQSGAAEGVDVYQRLVNANFNLNIRRTRLLQDFSGLAVDRPGAEAMQRFQRDLGDLQIELDRQPAACWRMEPKFLKANINA